MAKTIHLNAPESLLLHDLTEEQVRNHVIKEAQRLVQLLPEGIRPSRDYSVILAHQVAGDSFDYWGSWCRDCDSPLPRGYYPDDPEQGLFRFKLPPSGLAKGTTDRATELLNRYGGLGHTIGQAGEK